MNKDDLQKRLNSAEKKLEELEQLKAEIESLKVKLSDVQDGYIPDCTEFKCEEDYYYIDEYLDVTDGFGSDAVSDFNRFHTKEYAEVLAKKSKEVAMLLHCKWYVDRHYVPDWNVSTEVKSVVFYDNHKDMYDVGLWSTHEYGNVYFSTREAAQKAADWMNKHINKESKVLR